MSSFSTKMFAYIGGGLALIGLSKIAPSAAVATSTVLLTATLFAHTQEFTALVNRMLEALNEKATPGPIAIQE